MKCCLCGCELEGKGEFNDPFPLDEHLFTKCCSSCFEHRVVPAKKSKAFSVAEEYIWNGIGGNIIRKEAIKHDMSADEFNRLLFVTWFKNLYYLDFLGFDKYLK